MLSREQRAATIAKIKAETPEAWKQFGRTTEKSIDQCLERGYCVSLGDFRPQIHAAAAPLARLRDGTLLAINCGIEAYRLRAGELEGEFGPRLVALAASIRALDNTATREAA
jgi:DNA-binding IclR family transcriptional regulator